MCISQSSSTHPLIVLVTNDLKALSLSLSPHPPSLSFTHPLVMFAPDDLKALL